MHRYPQLPVPSESRAAYAQPDAAARKRCNGRECWMVCCREKPRAHPDTEAGTNRLAKPAPTARNPAEEPAGELHRRFARRSCVSSFCSALTPELSRPAKRVRLGRLVMRAKVNPKPLACNGSGRTGSTEERSASSGQVEASKDRSRQRRQSEGHETILVPSGANAVHPKPSEAKPEGESEPNRSVTDQRRRQRRNVSR